MNKKPEHSSRKQKPSHESGFVVAVIFINKDEKGLDDNKNIYIHK